MARGTMQRRELPAGWTGCGNQSQQGYHDQKEKTIVKSHKPSVCFSSVICLYFSCVDKNSLWCYTGNTQYWIIFVLFFVLFERRSTVRFPHSTTMAKQPKGCDAKLQGLTPNGYGSQLPKESLLKRIYCVQALFCVCARQFPKGDPIHEFYWRLFCHRPGHCSVSVFL